jgi:hypothetical protein
MNIPNEVIIAIMVLAALNLLLHIPDIFDQIFYLFSKRDNDE